MSELISVIVPVYNVEEYLSECVDSVLKQTYTNLEVLLIDDGSLDSSGKLCDEYATKDDRIKVYHKQNGGVSSARNLGLDVANGEYVTFVDSDDYIDENYVLKLYQALQGDNADMAFCGFANYLDGKLEKFDEYFPIDLSVDVNDKRFLKTMHNFLSGWRLPFGVCWRILYKKELVCNFRFNTEMKWGEDTLFCLQNIMGSKKINAVTEVLYFYRYNPKSAVHVYRKNYLQNQLVFYKEMQKLSCLFNEKKSIDFFNVEFSLVCYGVFSNEIRYKVFDKQIIKNTRQSELYKYFTLKNGLKIHGIKSKIKFLIVWFLVKTRIV